MWKEQKSTEPKQRGIREETKQEYEETREKVFIWMKHMINVMNIKE